MAEISNKRNRRASDSCAVVLASSAFLLEPAYHPDLDGGALCFSNSSQKLITLRPATLAHMFSVQTPSQVKLFTRSLKSSSLRLLGCRIGGEEVSGFSRSQFEGSLKLLKSKTPTRSASKVPCSPLEYLSH